MELAFRTRELRSICEDEDVAAERFDPRVVGSLKRRLADLRAADSVDDLVAGHPRLASDPYPAVSLDLACGYELVCHVNHPNPQVGADRQLSWPSVRRLQVTAIAKKEGADA